MGHQPPWKHVDRFWLVASSGPALCCPVGTLQQVLQRPCTVHAACAQPDDAACLLTSLCLCCINLMCVLTCVMCLCAAECTLGLLCVGLFAGCWVLPCVCAGSSLLCVLGCALCVCAVSKDGSLD